MSNLSDSSHFLDNPIVNMEQAHADARGSIQPLVDEKMESAVLITSKKDTVRANHYHKTDWHYCLLLEGQIDYYWRPKGSTLTPRKVTIKKGELFFTPPLVEHAMHFTQDSSFLCLGRNSRDQEVYEADIERVNVFQL